MDRRSFLKTSAMGGIMNVEELTVCNGSNGWEVSMAPDGTIVNVLGLPTSQLHQQSTFTDWDFIEVWNIGENQTYPYLRTVPAGDINKDRITNLLDLCIVAEHWSEEQ